LSHSLEKLVLSLALTARSLYNSWDRKQPAEVWEDVPRLRDRGLAEWRVGGSRQAASRRRRGAKEFTRSHRWTIQKTNEEKISKLQEVKTTHYGPPAHNTHTAPESGQH
jgi:hypothetical protein